MSLHSPSEPADPAGESVTVRGYAVGPGQLRVGDDFFELDFSPNEYAVVRRAIMWDEQTPDMFAQSVSNPGEHGWKGSTFVGDLAALDMLVDCLERFEQEAAKLGEDKLAYDARTALNHAKPAIREHL